ncbi:hypothetical protein F4781DRAFT_393752 [Annulohypoxylon bovei var. microspora]|nr:hypothetical protein F4781DRAFT_393752 [Annulohypoxylon bovei var. microspora]
MISMCQVLRSWLRAGVVKGLDPLFYSYSDELEDSKVEQMSDDELAAWTRGWLDLVEAGDDDVSGKTALNTP